MMSKYMMRLLLLSVFVMTILVGPAYADSFNALPKDVQKTLRNFQGRWADIPEKRQMKLIKGATRWNALSVDQRSKAKSRFNKFKTLSKDQRKQAMKRMEYYRGLSHKKKQVLRKNYKRYKTLSDKQKWNLRDRFFDRKNKKRLHEMPQIRERNRSEIHKKNDQMRPPRDR